MAETRVRLVSLEPGAFEVGSSPEQCSLLGNTCQRCGLAFFPRRHFCTRCCNARLDEIELSKRGSLKSFTSVYQKPKYAVVEPPYLVGEIELPEKVVVYSLITQCSREELKLGAEMELAAIKVREEEREGIPVTLLAYAFRPS